VRRERRRAEGKKGERRTKSDLSESHWRGSNSKGPSHRKIQARAEKFLREKRRGKEERRGETEQDEKRRGSDRCGRRNG